VADNQDIEDKPDFDDFEADVRGAIGDLNLEGPAEVKVEIDKPDTRARDEAGKFIETDKAKPVAAKQTEQAAPGVQVPSQPIGQPIVQAPQSLRAEFKEKFSQLPPEWQAEITRREADTAKALASQDEERLLGKKVNEMAMPYLPTIRAEGATVEKAFSDYLQTAHVLRSGTDIQKAQAVASVINSFKVNPQALFSVLQGANVVPGQQPPSAYDPRLDTLQQRLNQIEQDRQAEIQQRQLQEQHSLQSQIEAFSSKPGHEHFDRVRTHMGILLENGIASDMDDAYNRAVYADPDIRSTLLATAQPGQRQSEATARTARAKNAAVSVTGAPGSSRPLNGSKSLGSIEDDLRAAIAEHGGRV
jgi:hypothetical protein